MGTDWHTEGSVHHETLFSCKGNQVLIHILQGAGGGFILWRYSKATWTQLAIGGLAWAIGLDKMTSRAFLPQPFSDSDCFKKCVKIALNWANSKEEDISISNIIFPLVKNFRWRPAVSSSTLLLILKKTSTIDFQTQKVTGRARITSRRGTANRKYICINSNCATTGNLP